MASKPVRPRSPHVFGGMFALHYRWSPAMLVSILHRATGSGMATIGAGLLVWQLAALASGAEAYATFVDTFTIAGGKLNILGWIVGVGLTLALFQHMMGGIRHLILDTGAAYELTINRTLALLTMVASVLLTMLFWFYLGMR